MRACGRVFVDVGERGGGGGGRRGGEGGGGVARLCVCACARDCTCEILRTSALVTQLPDTFSLLLDCMLLCPVLTALFSVIFLCSPIVLHMDRNLWKVCSSLHDGIRA